MNLVFTPMQLEHLDAVVAAEKESSQFPWSRALFADSMHAGYSSWVLYQEGVLIGHAVLLAVMDESHLLVITVRPRWQGQGFGSRLLEHVLERASLAGATQMFLEVRASNRVAQAMYSRHGFKEIGRRRGYYPDADGLREDALVMQRALSGINGAVK
jgi:[ribosomal protein S18]-alanine N-acetyltransferase